MFTALLNFFASLWRGLVAMVQGIWDFCKAGWVWIVATIVGFVSILHHVSTYIYGIISDIAATLTGMAVAGQPASHQGTAGSILGYANIFLPVQEFFTLCTAYMLIVAACYTYRLVKSWIPTLS